MRTTVNLTLSDAIVGRPADQEQRFIYENVDVSVEDRKEGGKRNLYVTMNEPLKGVGEFNHAWITLHNEILEGEAKSDAGRNLIIISLYHYQESK